MIILFFVYLDYILFQKRNGQQDDKPIISRLLLLVDC